MNGYWRIVDNVTNQPLPGETHMSSRSVQRALLIVNTHEIKNGRAERYRIEPPIEPADIRPIEQLDPPRWVTETLAKQALTGNVYGPSKERYPRGWHPDDEGHG